MVNFSRHNQQIIMYKPGEIDTYGSTKYTRLGTFFGNMYSKTSVFESGIPISTIEIRTRWFLLDPQCVLVIGDTGYRITSAVNPDFKRLELVIQVEVQHGFQL